MKTLLLVAILAAPWRIEPPMVQYARFAATYRCVRTATRADWTWEGEVWIEHPYSETKETRVITVTDNGKPVKETVITTRERIFGEPVAVYQPRQFYRPDPNNPTNRAPRHTRARETAPPRTLAEMLVDPNTPEELIPMLEKLIERED